MLHCVSIGKRLVKAHRVSRRGQNFVGVLARPKKTTRRFDMTFIVSDNDEQSANVGGPFNASVRARGNSVNGGLSSSQHRPVPQFG